jgi:hypothetical protein
MSRCSEFITTPDIKISKNILALIKAHQLKVLARPISGVDGCGCW